ncbi:MAG: 50S ribosomal protein L10 [Patescibacteria group bacterium]|mgnify:CR=1 FL=1
MPKTKAQKEVEVNAVIDKIKGAKSIIIANCAGLSVAASQELRRQCRSNQVEFVSAKKTLLAMAFEKIGVDKESIKAMTGSLAVAISRDDEVAPAKILKDFAKTHEQVFFTGGVIDGALVGVDFVKKLSDLPSKLELLSKLVGSLSAPLSGLVNVLQGNLRGLVYVLNAIKTSKTS